jgi:hypothetical protein
MVALGRSAEAMDVYRRGIDVAGRAGDQHARRELESALAELGPITGGASASLKPQERTR